MKLLLYSFGLALLVSVLSFGKLTLTQTAAAGGTLQTGFAVITPVSGTGAGLSVSETFGQQIGSNVFQASVVASPLVTLTNVVLSVDPAVGTDTGIAMINPNATAATVTLSLGNQQGATISTRTITVAPHQQISQFATQLFAGDPNFTHALTGLLFISSDLPIGVVGLTFSGGTFTALPVAAQLNTNNVVATSAISTVTAPATVTTPVPTSFNGVTFTSTVPPTAFAPVTPTFNGVPTPPTLLPPTISAVPITGTASTLVTSTGTVASSTAVVPAFATAPTAVSTGMIFVFPQISAGVGGTGAMLLPQVASGGGWVTQITIANTSQFPQSVRVDLFNAAGGMLSVSIGSTIPSIVIAPGGVATLVV